MERETQRQEEKPRDREKWGWEQRAGKKNGWASGDRDEVPPSNSPFADVQISGLT